MLQVAPQEDQAAGAALAFGGGDAELGAVDLAFEGFFPEALSFQKLFFCSFSSWCRARVGQDQDSLAGVELLDGSGPLDPASLHTSHRAAQSRPANKLGSPADGPLSGPSAALLRRVGLKIYNLLSGKAMQRQRNELVPIGTAAERASGPTTKPNPKPESKPRIASAKGPVKPLVRLLRVCRA